jgi:hypothetical protein
MVVISCCSFTKHPFLDVGGTVEHRDSFRHTLVQEANALDIHKTHLRQIQNDRWSGACEFGFHLINMARPKLSA